MIRFLSQHTLIGFCLVLTFQSTFASFAPHKQDCKKARRATDSRVVLKQNSKNLELAQANLRKARKAAHRHSLAYQPSDTMCLYYWNIYKQSQAHLTEAQNRFHTKSNF